MDENLKILLEFEFKKLYEKYWINYLNKDYKSHVDRKFHRSENIPIKSINDIKKEIYQKLGAIPIYIFLASFCNNIKIPGAHNTIDKILCVIFQLIDGCSTHDMNRFWNDTTYFRIYKEIFITNEKSLNKWIDYMYENFFSNLNIRLLSAKYKNPSMLKNITMIMDGHHNKIIYENIKMDRKDMYLTTI